MQCEYKSVSSVLGKYFYFFAWQNEQGISLPACEKDSA